MCGGPDGLAGCVVAYLREEPRIGQGERHPGGALAKVEDFGERRSCRSLCAAPRHLRRERRCRRARHRRGGGRPRSRRCCAGARGREPRRRVAHPTVRRRHWALAPPSAETYAARMCPVFGSGRCGRPRRAGRAASHGPRAFALDGVEHLLIGAAGEHVHGAAACKAAFTAVQPDLGTLACVEVAQGLRHVVQLK